MTALKDLTLASAIPASAVGLGTIPQAAIADLNLGTLALLTEVITALGTVQGKINTILAELRSAGIIAT